MHKCTRWVVSFFILGNICSQLKSIFLVCVATSPVIHKYGVDNIRAPFVRDIRTLAVEKHTVNVNSIVEEYEVAQSMSFAYRFCRSCMCTTADAQCKFVESAFKLRSSEEHAKECDDLEKDANKFSKEYGINPKVYP